MIKTNRSIDKFLLLGIVTFGIYWIFYFNSIAKDMNTIASRHDGKKTMNFFLVLLLSCVTFGVAELVWFHKLSNRIGDELARRGIPYAFSSGTYWGWFFFGAFIGIGPFVYIYKLCVSMNLLAEDYNEN